MPNIEQLLQLELNALTENNLSNLNQNINQYQNTCLSLYNNLSQLESKIDTYFDKLESLRAPKRGRNRQNNYQTFPGIKGSINDKLTRLEKLLKNIKIDLDKLISNPKFKDVKCKLEQDLNLRRHLNARNNHYNKMLSNPNFEILSIENPHLAPDITLLIILIWISGKEILKEISNRKKLVETIERIKT